MFNLGRMSGYGSKVAGMVVAAIGTVTLLVNNYVHLQLIPGFDAGQHGLLYWWVILMGLYMMAFSKERNDDERVQAVRGFAMRVAFTMSMASMLSIAITAWVAVDMQFDASSLLIIPTFCLLMYHIIFHLGIYFDGVFKYSNHPDIALPKPNKQKGWQYILYFSIIAILLGLMAYKTFIAK